MERVGSRASDDVDDRSAREPELRREIGLLNLELLDRIHRGRIGRHLNSAVLLEVCRARAIN